MDCDTAGAAGAGGPGVPGREAGSRLEFSALAGLLDRTDTQLAYLDSELRFVWANEAYVAGCGHARDELLGRRHFELFPDEENEAIFRRVLTTGQSVEFQGKPFVFADQPGRGVTYWDWKLHPHGSASGVAGLFLALTDVTASIQAERKLTEAESSYRTLFAHMLEGFAYCRMLYDERGRPEDFVYLEVNGAFERLTGLKEVVGRKVTEAIPGIKAAHPELFEVYGRVASTRVPERLELRFKPLNLWLSLSVYSPAPGHFAVVFENVTERKRNEEAVRQSEERYRIMGEILPYGVWLTDAEGKAEYASPSFLELLDMTQEEQKGFGWIRRLVPEDVAPTLERWMHCVRTGEEWDCEHRIRDRHGEIRTILTRGRPVCDSEGKIIAWAGINLEITERKRIEEQLRRREQEYRALVEHSPDVIVRFDRELRRTFANAALERLTGLPLASLLGKSIRDSELGAEFSGAFEAALRRVFETGTDETVEVPFKTAARTGYRHLRLIPEFSPAGEVESVLTVGRDITALKALELDLREAKERAEEANRAKSEFLARMSHEIRTPMNGIMGMTELALMEERLPRRAREYLGLARQSAQGLLAIINDILDLARVEAGRVEIESKSFELRAALGSVLATLALAARKKGIRLSHRVEPGVPVTVVGDEGRLRQVLMNLVGNAVKFTERGHAEVSVGLAGEIGISSAESRVSSEDQKPVSTRSLELETRTSRDRVRLLFTVRDTGIGISPGDLGSVFDSFSRATKSTHAQFGGTGLGLSIAKQLIELMGGRIWAESEPGVGSVFRFSVEVGLSEYLLELTAPALRPRAGPGPGPLRVLVAEDNPLNQIFAREILLRLGHDVVLASDGEEALRVLSENRFHVVLMDIQMPRLDGDEATRRIRAGLVEGCPRDLPVVAVTAHATEGDRERFLGAGMDDYVSKPFTVEALKEVLARVSEGARRNTGSGEPHEERTR
jgi:PAS domain S-box-containing protein